MALQDYRMIICPSGSYSVSVKDKNGYKTEMIKVEDSKGELHKLKGVQVCTPGEVDAAYDPTGQSNVYAIVRAETAVRIPEPSEKDTSAENPMGNYIPLGNICGTKNSDDITRKVQCQTTETSREMYRAFG
jgi:hypothetical protein